MGEGGGGGGGATGGVRGRELVPSIGTRGKGRLRAKPISLRFLPQSQRQGRARAPVLVTVHLLEAATMTIRPAVAVL